MPIELLVAAALAHMVEFTALPAALKNETETCEFIDYPSAEHTEYGNRYSWAVPTREAVEAIARYGIPIVDFGAGTGLWANLLSDQGVDVVAYDDWSWGKPDRLWFDVRHGDVSSLAQHSDRAMLLVWPPAGSRMAVDALREWNGNLLFYVGEVLRVNGTPAFFAALRDGWHLERRIDLPNWKGKVDELYVLRRGEPDAGWMAEAVSRCDSGAATFFAQTDGGH